MRIRWSVGWTLNVKTVMTTGCAVHVILRSYNRIYIITEMVCSAHRIVDKTMVWPAVAARADHIHIFSLIAEIKGEMKRRERHCWCVCAGGRIIFIFICSAPTDNIIHFFLHSSRLFESWLHFFYGIVSRSLSALNKLLSRLLEYLFSLSLSSFPSNSTQLLYERIRVHIFQLANHTLWWLNVRIVASDANFSIQKASVILLIAFEWLPCCIHVHFHFGCESHPIATSRHRHRRLILEMFVFYY